MPTAIVDVDVERIPAELVGLERYERALVLLRVRGHPVGQMTLPVTHGRIDGAAIRDYALDRERWPLWERWLLEHIGWDPVNAASNAPRVATVVIITHDRPDDLQRALEAVLRLEPDGEAHEILVVDNCPSSDDTRALVAGYRGVRYVREDRRGASAARNRALSEARHDIVAFTDDDAAPDPGWLRALLRNFDDPLVYCATGLTMPLELETDAQEASERYTPHGRGYSRIVFSGSRCNPLSVGQVGVSLNMALRRSVLEHVGAFDELLGPGTPCRCGEDYDLFSRILAAGYRIVYDPAALSWHRHRRTWEELHDTVFGYGVGVYAWWTRSVLVEREWSAMQHALRWFVRKQMPTLARALRARRRSPVPASLVWAELRGCMAGPWAYLASRHRARRASRAARANAPAPATERAA
ncbi:MAG TPA: glycosyltransferase [Gemmatimonadaceae bacterium]|nr:glycosyltransferase [Gemmatimonadaceae bacterium]